MPALPAQCQREEFEPPFHAPAARKARGCDHAPDACSERPPRRANRRKALASARTMIPFLRLPEPSPIGPAWARVRRTEARASRGASLRASRIAARNGGNERRLAAKRDGETGWNPHGGIAERSLAKTRRNCLGGEAAGIGPTISPRRVERSPKRKTRGRSRPAGRGHVPRRGSGQVSESSGCAGFAGSTPASESGRRATAATLSA